MRKGVFEAIQSISIVVKDLGSIHRWNPSADLRNKLSGEVAKHQALANIFAEELQHAKKDVRIVTLEEFLSKSADSRVGNRDLYCTIGGDGTFLQTAQVIRGSRNLALGINPDTSNSLGALSGCEVKTTDEPRTVARKLTQTLLEGSFDLVTRHRVLAVNTSDPGTKYPLALNEALLAERKYNRCLKYQFQYENVQDWQNIRSSGFLVSTGTGSSGLLISLLKLRKDQLELLAEMKLLREDIKVTEDLLARLNSESLFHPSDTRGLRFIHRNLVGQSGIHPEQGWGKIFRVKNKTYQSLLCMDTTEFKVDYNHELVFKEAKDPDDVLNTLHLRTQSAHE